MNDVEKYDDYGAADQSEIRTELFAFESFLHLPEQKQIEDVEVNSEQDHEDCDNPLDIRRKA